MNDRTETSSPRRPSVYESAIDLWLAVLLLLGPAIATGAGLMLLFDGRHGDASILFLIAAFILLFTVAVTLPCRYTLLDDAVSIRCGLICYQIPYADIRDVQPSRSLRSAPALSLRRVAITTDRRTVLVSPKDRDRFLEDLRTETVKLRTRLAE